MRRRIKAFSEATFQTYPGWVQIPSASSMRSRPREREAVLRAATFSCFMRSILRFWRLERDPMRYRADIRTLAYLAACIGLFAYQWHYAPGLANWYLYPLSLLLAYTAAVMSHNQNHLPMWGKNRVANLLTN